MTTVEFHFKMTPDGRFTDVREVRMTKLEQVARAIADRIIDLGGGEGFGNPDYESGARAAVEAMREPTKEMVGIGQVHEMYDTSAAINLDVWTAMIDALLSEKTNDQT
jgi:hypothetical protein